MANKVILQCVDCKKNTSPTEAYERLFNEGRCGECNGAFEVIFVDHRRAGMGLGRANEVR